MQYTRVSKNIWVWYVKKLLRFFIPSCLPEQNPQFPGTLRISSATIETRKNPLGLFFIPTHSPQFLGSWQKCNSVNTKTHSLVWGPDDMTTLTTTSSTTTKRPPWHTPTYLNTTQSSLGRDRAGRRIRRCGRGDRAGGRSTPRSSVGPAARSPPGDTDPGWAPRGTPQTPSLHP